MASNKGKESASPARSAAVQAWEAGDVASARRLAEETLKAGTTGAAADEAKELLERARLPPLAFWLGAGVAAAYTALVLLSRSFG
ncbi:MAG: hypothetical protein RL653_4400 [Pseudomonadota bacterium]|jgi:hypothetical protein